jgi:lycopene beta-cyclase
MSKSSAAGSDFENQDSFRVVRVERRVFDYVLVGGGLQNALIALAVLAARPTARIALVERGLRIGGNHLWAFHAGDVSLPARAFIEPLVVHRWPGYDVAFPGRARRLDAPYEAVSSAKLDEVVRRSIARSPNAIALLGSDVTAVGEHRVELADGRVLHATAVIDARGPDRFAAGAATGYQKFLGLELELETSSGFDRPLLMDARVPQTDGFRFMYALPLAERRLLLEDTYFSSSAELEPGRLREAILAYAMAAGFRVARITREETGVLALPLRAPAMRQAGSPLLAGYAGGWFHPTTGYSFPIALRLAELLASAAPDELFGPRFAALAAEQERQARFAVLLNRLLFGAFQPADRWNALDRFYRLPEPTIRRFYALRTNSGDRARILCGRPPRGLSLRALLGRTELAGASA